MTIAHQAIHSSKAPEAIGPYSQAIKSGPWLFCSGQIPLEATTQKLVPGGIEEQTKKVLENLSYVIEQAGGSLQNVTKTTIFLQDLRDFQKVNQIYSSFFKAPYPARSTFAVQALPLGSLVEIEAVAYLGKDS